VKQIFVCKSFTNYVEISWDAPDDNNSQIIKYNVYLSDKIIQNIGSPDLSIQSDNPASSNHNYRQVDTIDNRDQLDECYYKVKNLIPNTAYFVILTAVNEFGEGYKPI